jgi:23S rRNA (cytidine1920-2'-O)/16S rRNA (cytidine1409-2'-O)-methyltransferase
VSNSITLPFISRAGLKLERALKIFKIDVNNKICLDIGASTGGFTDCLLKYGAQKVYAVDVGTDQLHHSLKNNQKVISYEKTDARDLTFNHIPEKVDILVSDVSFISILKIIPAIIRFLKDNFEGVILIKPQFELSPQEVKKGIIKDKSLHIKAINKILEGLKQNNISVIDLDYSYPFGTDGNIEFLAHIKYGKKDVSKDKILSVVENAHTKLKGLLNGSS